MDVLRFPLGILTGVGFIGGGAILKRGRFVTGVTTAATLWAMTAIGLCFGGGQLGLGVAATAIAAFTLWVLKWLDVRIPREQRARLVIRSEDRSPPDLNAFLSSAGYRARFLQLGRTADARHSSFSFEIRWTRPEAADQHSALLALLERHYAIESFALATEAIH